MCAIKQRAETAGYIVGLPDTDPHGMPWVNLSDDALMDRAGWCMLPAFHEALRAEFIRRRELRAALYASRQIALAAA